MYGPGSRVMRRGDYIWGSFIRPERLDGYINAVNPGEREDILGRFGFSLRSVDDAVMSARQAARRWRSRSFEQRAACVRRLFSRIEEHADHLSTLISRETGRPLWDAREEVALAHRAVRLLVSEGESWLTPVVRTEGVAWSEPRPHGVVAVLMPWTQPLLLPVLYASAAMLAGNSVVVKPSKFTPAVGQAFAELIDRCGLPRGVFNLVQGSGAQIGERLATHPDTDAIVFAGRASTVRRLREANRDRPMLPIFALTGGKATALVLDDADLDAAAYQVVIGAFASTGQRPDATARVYVSRTQFDAFAARLVEKTHALEIGYAFDKEAFMGPMISEPHRRVFRRKLEHLRTAGGKALVEGGLMEVEGHRGYYTRPGVTWLAAPLSGGDALEGPSLSVRTVPSLDEALLEIGSLGARGSLSIFGQDTERAVAVGQELPFGTIHINRSTLGGSLRLPSTPRGRSGNGWDGGLGVLRFLAPSSAIMVHQADSVGTVAVPGTGVAPVEGVEDDAPTLPG